MRNSKERYINLTHPNPASASSIFTALAEILKLPLVCYSDWLIALEASTHGGGTAIGLPALVLLPFYRSAATVPTANTEAFGFPAMAISHATSEAPKVYNMLRQSQLTRTDVESWVLYWRRIGFLGQ